MAMAGRFAGGESADAFVFPGTLRCQVKLVNQLAKPLALDEF
jgi:hypothetical protein